MRKTTLVANYKTGSVRRASLMGVPHLVVPVTMIVPGVLNGSRGPILYMKTENDRSFDQWNGMPIVVNHPYNEQGQPISARTENVLNQTGVGIVLNAVSDDVLRAEAWINIERANAVDPRIVLSIESGVPMEMSTGIQRMSRLNRSGTFNSQHYTSVARGIVPDHLALLPDTTGACSLADGCGLLVNTLDTTTLVEGTRWKRVTNDKKEVVYKIFPPSPKDHKPMPKARRKATTDEQVDYLINAECSCWNEDDRELLTDMEDNALTRLVENAKSAKADEDKRVANAKKKAAEANADDDEEEEDPKKPKAFNVGDLSEEELQTELDKRKKMNEKKASKANNEQAAPPTEEEWISNAPASVREDLQFARAEKDRQKTAIVVNMTGHIEDDAVRKTAAEKLSAMSLSDLTALEAITPKSDKSGANNEQEQGVRHPSYRGAAAPRPDAKATNNTVSNEDKGWSEEDEAMIPQSSWYVTESD